MMQKVKILPFSQEQLPAAAALAQRCFPDPWSLALFEAAFSQPDTTLFAAMAGDTLAGYLILQRLGDEESVDDIAVAPEFRRQGIAQQLLETAHAQFPTCPFLLEVREHNTAALALYQKLGYQQVVSGNAIIPIRTRCGTDDPTPTIKGGTPCNKPSNWEI